MSRLAAFGIGLAVAVSDIAAIVILTGFGQALADSAYSPTAPWWLMPAWLVTFFPAGLALWLLWFNHPMGLGPNDHIIWSSLILLNGVLWGAITYLLVRWFRGRAGIA